MKTYNLNALVQQEDDGYVSFCPELDIASQGNTPEEAIANLKEAVEGFFECASKDEVRQRLHKTVLVTHFEAVTA